MRRSKLLLNPLHKKLLYGMTGILWLSGAIWLYLVETDPLRPLWMKLHGAAAMAFLILFGAILFDHVPAGWKQQRQRPSGISLTTTCGILVLSGWGLYYLGNETARHWTSQTHSLLGLALPVIIFVHVWMSNKKVKEHD